MSKTPDFIIIGAMKCATTSLYNLISRSQDVFLPDQKEPSLLTHYQKVDDCRHAYEKHFVGAPDGKKLGEATTHYTMRPLFQDVSGFAKSVCGPDLKLIMIVRNPMDRIISHLRHDYNVGRLGSDNFANAIETDPRYLKVSNYAYQLAPWVSQFGLQNLLVVDFDKLKQDPNEVYQTVCEFLEIEPTENVENANIHANRNNDLSMVQSSVIAHFVRGNLYQNTIRKVIPKSLTQCLKKMLSRQRQQVGVTLPPEKMAETLNALKLSNQKLTDLTGFPTAHWSESKTGT